MHCRTGKCAQRDVGACKQLHDPGKVAVCSRWLTGTCQDPSCPFQHTNRPDLMPLCTHYMKVHAIQDSKVPTQATGCISMAALKTRTISPSSASVIYYAQLAKRSARRKSGLLSSYEGTAGTQTAANCVACRVPAVLLCARISMSGTTATRLCARTSLLDIAPKELPVIISISQAG